MQSKILEHLYNEVAFDPRAYGKALKGSKYGKAWRYRVGDYRIICNIDDSIITIHVIKIGHRRDVYIS